MSDEWFVVLGLLAVIGLVAANGLFVATEFSYVAVRRTRIEQLAERGNARGRLVLSGLRDLDTYIAATQLGITMSSLALGWVGEPALAHLIEPPAEAVVGSFAASGVAHATAVALAFLVITVLHIVFGELAPKTLALQRSEATALWVSAPITVFNRVFRPFIWVMNAAGRLVVRPLGVAPAAEHDVNLAPEELEMVIEASARAGLLSTSELLIARRALEYGEIQADQIMVPRTEVSGVDLDSSLEDVLDTVRDRDHRRYPVFDGDLDHITGILDTKDLIRLVHEDRTDWRSLVRPAVAIPESVTVEAAVAEMSAHGVQMVVVIDEHGGTSGILTGDQVLNRLLGRWHGGIRADERARIHRLATGNYLLDGLTLMSDVEDIIGGDLASDEYDTVGGFLMARLGRIPVVGDRIRDRGHDFRVMAMDGKRVDRVLLMATEERDARG